MMDVKPFAESAEVDEKVVKALDIQFVEHMDEVLETALVEGEKIMKSVPFANDNDPPDDIDDDKDMTPDSAPTPMPN